MRPMLWFHQAMVKPASKFISKFATTVIAPSIAMLVEMESM